MLLHRPLILTTIEKEPRQWLKRLCAESLPERMADGRKLNRLQMQMLVQPFAADILTLHFAPAL